MPIYDYKCKCGEVVKDRLASHSEEVKCKCGKKMDRCISAPNIGGMDEFGRTKK